MGASAPICICTLSIAPRFRNCKRPQGNFSHFGRSTKNTRRFWAKWRKIRASLRPWPPLGGGCRRSRLGERNYVLRLSLRRPTGDTSLTEGGKREGRGSTPPETLCKTGGRGRTPPLRAVLRKYLRKSSLPPSAQSADTSLAEGGKREGRGSAPPETLCKIGGRGRAPPLHTGRTMTAQGRGGGAKKGPPGAVLFCRILLVFFALICCSACPSSGKCWPRSCGASGPHG